MSDDARQDCFRPRHHDGETVGARDTVELILRKLGNGQTVEGLIEDYPAITRDDILAAQAFEAAGQGTH